MSTDQLLAILGGVFAVGYLYLAVFLEGMRASEKTLKLRDVRRKLSVARFIERITRKELFRLGVHADLVRANKLTCELEAEMARLSA